MQGRLRNESLEVTARTECAHCRLPLEMTIDSDLNYRVREKDCQPIVFIRDVDILNIDDESIINDF